MRRTTMIISFLTFSFVICFFDDMEIANYVDETTSYTYEFEIEKLSKFFKKKYKLFDWFSNNFWKASANKCYLLISTDENVTLKNEKCFPFLRTASDEYFSIFSGTSSSKSCKTFGRFRWRSRLWWWRSRRILWNTRVHASNGLAVTKCAGWHGYNVETSR